MKPNEMNDYLALQIVCKKLLEAAKNEETLQSHLLALAEVIGGIKTMNRHIQRIKDK